MPNYTFENKKTKKEFTLTMKMNELGPYLIANPDVQQIFNTFPGIAAPWNIGGVTGKATNAKKGFKEVLNKIHKRTPGSRLNKTTDM
jgi:hypothetical protein